MNHQKSNERKNFWYFNESTSSVAWLKMLGQLWKNSSWDVIIVHAQLYGPSSQSYHGGILFLGILKVFDEYIFLLCREIQSVREKYHDSSRLHHIKVMAVKSVRIAYLCDSSIDWKPAFGDSIMRKMWSSGEIVCIAYVGSYKYYVPSYVVKCLLT